ncbi:MAG TPA: hypothetical protein VKV17_15985 [Bryobacteraceae bacterium]|nr:hypothetical protein [Bryobacteraceae bacterium]
MLSFRYLLLLSLASATVLLAVDADRDFSGEWVLERAPASGRFAPAEPRLTIRQNDLVIRCTAASPGNSPTEWSYLLDGTETRFAAGDEMRSSIVKWEGAALLVNTLVSGARNYTQMDRWRLSKDGSTLTIARQIVDRGGTSEDTLVYRRQGLSGREAPPGAPVATAVVAPASGGFRPAAPREQEIVITAGTHIPLALRNAVDTKHSHEGDRVYLETIAPVAANSRIVIPRGSFVNGTITESKPAHGVKGKGELFLRFDSLTLPNGVMREFHSRLAGGSPAQGQVDSKEGKVTGERDGSSDVRDVALTTGIGASVGGIAGSAAGHPLGGVGIGAAAGAAAGLTTIFHDKRPEVVLRQGTVIDMVLDRDLQFKPGELPN